MPGTTIENPPAAAACLTPPGTGGIAVVQVIGPAAHRIVQPHLRARPPLDLAAMPPDTLRLCRVVDGPETIDDALVAVRRDHAGRAVVDLNLHGGRRVVQRVLLLLKHAGAAILDPRDLLRVQYRGQPFLHWEAADALTRVKTRPVALWIASTLQQMPRDLATLRADLDAGRLAEARDLLARRCDQGRRTPWLLDGPRVAIVGGPNAGKSTLANRLAGREAAIVSDQPGTTRDWTEQPGAIAGIPFTFVDTAGLRPTGDPIEQEAIRRSHDETRRADLILRVIDAAIPHPRQDHPAIEANGTAPPRLCVWNKTDLPRHPDHESLMALAGPAGLAVSALTGDGLDALRDRILSALGLADWESTEGAPFTPRQQAACHAALSALQHHPPDPQAAARRLEGVVSAILK